MYNQYIPSKRRDTVYFNIIIIFILFRGVYFKCKGKLLFIRVTAQ